MPQKTPEEQRRYDRERDAQKRQWLQERWAGHQRVPIQRGPQKIKLGQPKLVTTKGK